MKRFLLVMFVIALIVAPLALVGCKGKVEKAPEEARMEMPEVISPTQEMAVTTEPSQNIATEVIPPTAAPAGIAEKQPAMSQGALDRNKEIQTALKKAGYYNGAIDGKIGPRTKKAIEDFQRDKGLKVDGKVGPKTWAELEKHLIQQ